MFLQPKRTKYQKLMRNRGSFKGNATSGHRLAYGEFGLKATGRGELTARQLEAARRAIAHETSRIGKMWVRVFPDKQITQKAAEVPMGSGKGAVDHWVAPIKPGRILFEVNGITEETAREAFRKAAAKLPFGVKFVSHEII